MKTKILSLLLILSCMGCAALKNPTTLARVQSASKVAAYVGTSEFLRQHPETRPAFESARNSLLILESAEHVDLATLLAIVNQLPIKELKSDRAVLIITAATILLSDYASSLPVDKLDDLKPVARSIREGIQMALAPQP